MNEKILVIEDALDTLSSIIELLEDNGFQAIGAKNGLIGLQLVKEQLPDLVLSDINMPEVNGYQVLQGLRQHQNTAEIPIILMSGDTINLKHNQGFEFCADDYLLKPFMPRKLIEVVTAQLRKNKIKGELIT